MSEDISSPLLALVVPCYNEGEALPKTAVVLRRIMDDLVQSKKIDSKSCILFVDDGSVDNTWEEIARLHEGNGIMFRGVKLAHNKGHQNALFAGLATSLEFGVDAVISMDADLQDDPHVIPQMIEAYVEGAEIVYGVRNNRATDSVFKRLTAEMFYKVMKALGTETIPDHADFRLMGNKALSALMEYKEVNLFLRGIVPSLGFVSEKVYYSRGERVAGESKYPLRKMVSFALEGITSFSIRPLQIITYVGLLSVFLGLGMLVYSVISVIEGSAVAGWASLMCSLWILGGLLLLALGIVGSYIGKIYLEVKARPRFVREKTL